MACARIYLYIYIDIDIYRYRYRYRYIYIGRHGGGGGLRAGEDLVRPNTVHDAGGGTAPVPGASPGAGPAAVSDRHDPGACHA